MNIDHILKLLTEDQKRLMQFMYAHIKYDINKMNRKFIEDANGLVNLGIAQKPKNTEKTNEFELTDFGRLIITTILTS